ncbi:hypothetical protein [Thermococcus argininiproducens]|nr:hypothetical protein [Thermococcus argininiproducens]
MMEKEIMELLRLERIREPLSPSKRVKDFQVTIQRTKNGEEIELAGFLLARKPPYAPNDAAYYLLSPLTPSELASLSKDDFRSYLVIRMTEMTEVRGNVRPGSHVRVKGVMDAYPWGNLRTVHTLLIEGREYPEYWKDYQEFALSRREVINLFERTVYMPDEMRMALIYSLYGVPYVLGMEQSRNWGEGFDFTVYKYRENLGLLALWKALKYLYDSLPWEVRVTKKTMLEIEDPFLGIDFRVRNPNGTDMKYYTPLKKISMNKLPKWVKDQITNKKAIGLLPENKEPNPTDLLARISETPFVLTPWEEKPYFEKNREFQQLMPNLLVTVFLQREQHMAMNTKDLEPFRKEFLKWIEYGRQEYPDMFNPLSSSPKGLFHINLRYLLDVRVFGAATRFSGKVTKKTIGDIRQIKEAILNDWAVVVKDHPEILMELRKDYERYVPRDVRAQRALQVFYDLSSTSITGDVDKEEFLNELLQQGFNQKDALELIERFISSGYVYEPFPGKLRLIR